MAFAIVRITKHNSLISIRHSGKHHYREQETLNADSQRTVLNSTEGAGTADALVQAIQSRVALATVKATGPYKPVLAVEYLITASPDFFKQQSATDINNYFCEAIQWLKIKHGEDNVVSITRHNDETTPHLAVFVVPLVQRPTRMRKRSVILGKDAAGQVIREVREVVKPAEVSLSAKHYFGVNKQTLSLLQSDFAETVGQKYGLQRGIKNSKATHQKISQFYTQIQQPISHIEISAESLQPKVLNKTFFSTSLETPQMIAERLTDAITKVYAPAVEKAKVMEVERQRACDMVATVKYAQLSEQKFNEQIALLRAEKQALLNAIKENGVELETIRRALKQKLRKI